MIHVRVNGIFITQSQSSGILLREDDGKRTLPIVIGEYEAQSIAMALEKITPPRPITHDLITNILGKLEISVESVIITEIKENTYYAIVRLVRNTEIIEIDSRPSDAIALAVRLGTSIFVNEAVMDEAAYIPENTDDPNKKFLFKTDNDQVENLKQQLAKAVESEDYEEAAKLRDRINRLESGS